ncbi:hypothetical protein DPMN_156173 [Dreissena polymorpha]|uniref:Uncharacterized protein n=1 Tax=Dreissena polymorpha TaxID=45954 RepID=A0A9D4FPB5_DREPO|nr:hypothetical protein DPMN_156173 [Dreissena polymorpha]
MESADHLSLIEMPSRVQSANLDRFPVRVQQQTCMKVGFCHKAREQWMGLSYP